MSKRKLFWGFLLILCMLICIGATIYIIIYFSSGSLSTNYRNQATVNQATTTENTLIKNAENHNLNWDKLKEDNNDIYAWIYIPNTNIDYPIVQPNPTEADDFYLNRNIRKQYEFAGSIYTERKTAKDFSDSVSLIYGHNMLNGSMFATLHKFEDKDFFKKNKYIYIYLPYRKLTYKIYAAYVYDDRHILNSFDFTDDKVLMDYFNYTLNPDSMTKNTRKVKLNLNSKTVTLSTCTSGAKNTRYLVQGVLIKDEQTN